MKPTVLFVDDEVHLLEGLKNALRKEPYEVVTASSAAEGLDLLSRRRVDVVVSDERMPGMCGAELLSIVRQRHPDTTRIMLTGQASMESTIRAINGGEIFRFLSKPCSPLEIAQQIRNALELKSLSRESVRLQELSKSLEQARDEALASARVKSEFMASMSHELRTPLNGVIGMADLLLETALSDEQREYAKVIQTSANALLTVLNDVLDFSKLEAEKMELESIDFDLRSLLEEVCDIVSVRSQEKQLELVMILERDVPRRLRGDPGRLRQILLNLAHNAVKFTPKGEVCIRASLLEGSGARAKILFEVIDDGIGIPAERRDRLFQAFSQVDVSTTRRYGGTGLGLAISKQLVERMHGSIGVESEEGKGSRFFFTVELPRLSASLLEDVRFEGLSMLVADDSARNRSHLAALLESWGCEQTTASSGVEALDALAEAAARGRPFQLALLDFQMPGMNGVELARAIKSVPALAGTSLILATSLPGLGEADGDHAKLFAARLAKPVKHALLAQAIAGLFTRAPARSEEGSRPMPAVQLFLSKKVLLVEDNAVNQKVAKRMLERRGYRFDVASNGKEALVALERGRYDVILMDCQMPEMDGTEAAQEIRRREAREGSGRHTPIVAMTAGALKGDREQCLAAGMDDYLSKPVRVHDLYAVLDRYLGGGVA